MPPSDFAKASIAEVVEQLTTDEAILLTVRVDFRHTHGVPRIGISPVKVRDGPNGKLCWQHYVRCTHPYFEGIRGNHFMMSTLANCFPSSTAMGATFDPC